MFGKRILLTGAHGFLGKYVSKRLWERGFTDVWSPRSEEYDLRKQDNVSSLFSRVGPEIVIHLAASVGGIAANQARPADFLYDNVLMGMNLMNISAATDVEKFMQIGSACSYPKNCPVPFKEEDLWNGYPEGTNAPYGIAKKVLLTYGQALRQQRGLNAIYLIPTNMYGPGDNFNPDTSHVIPALIRKIDLAMQKHEAIVDLWGSGLATRDFLYVEDCAEAIVKALEVYNSPEPLNLGSDHEISIAQVAEIIGSLMGFKGLYTMDVSQPDGQPRRSLDTTQAKLKLDFYAQTDIIQGLKDTIEWYLRETR